jgi:hypothetical protein
MWQATGAGKTLTLTLSQRERGRSLAAEDHQNYPRTTRIIRGPPELSEDHQNYPRTTPIILRVHLKVSRQCWPVPSTSRRSGWPHSLYTMKWISGGLSAESFMKPRNFVSTSRRAWQVSIVCR